jgi:hypothetical protein
MYLPLFGALHFVRFRDPRRALALCALALAPALFWMWRNQVCCGDALAPIHHIDQDHRALAQMALAWFGQLRFRLYGLAYWPIAICGIATPGLGLLSLWGCARALRRREPGWELVALAWLPAVYFAFRTTVLADFRPLARFAMVAAALGLPFAHGAYLSLRPALRRPALVACAALALLTPLSLAAASWNRNGALAEWARPLSPISSVPPGIAQAAGWLKENAQPSDRVLIDSVWDYLDLPLAFAAGLPDPQWIRLRWADDFEQRLSRGAPTLAVLIYQGTLGDWEKDRFDFRDLHFCLAARFVYAAIYRRCDR